MNSPWSYFPNFYLISLWHYSDVTWVAWPLNSLRPRQNGRLYADDTFKRIFLKENIRISIKISLKFVPKGPFNNIPALVLIMALHRTGNKPLSEPMMISLPMHIFVTRPQWVKSPELIFFLKCLFWLTTMDASKLHITGPLWGIHKWALTSGCPHRMSVMWKALLRFHVMMTYGSIWCVLK